MGNTNSSQLTINGVAFIDHRAEERTTQTATENKKGVLKIAINAGTSDIGPQYNSIDFSDINERDFYRKINAQLGGI